MNPLIQRLRDRKTCLNAWLMIPDALVAEMIAQTGWDSVTIDLQHGLFDFAATVRSLQALHGRGVAPLVRVPWNEPGILGKVLDAGAWGVICPMVNTADDARALVEACLYAPQGSRSYGPIRAGLYGGPEAYQHTANENVLVLPQIETVQAVENLEAILAVPGVSGVYVGPGDLGLAMGLPPVMDREEPEILRLYERVVAAAEAAGKIAAIHNATPAYAARMVRMGFHMVTAASDVGLLVFGAMQAVKAVQHLSVDTPPQASEPA